MKRFFASAIVLSFLFLTLLPASASALSYSSRDLKTALEQFQVCAFSAEYNDGGRNYTVRWEAPMSVYFEGNYTSDDLAFFYRFISDLNEKVPSIPEIRLTNNKDESNVQFYFIPLNQMGNYVTNYTEGNWGYFTFWYTGTAITTLEIGIATDVTNQKERNHLIMEEFIGGIGLANDHYIDDDSILYGTWTTTQTPTTADYLMLQFLYDESFEAGLTYNEIKPLIDILY